MKLHFDQSRQFFDTDEVAHTYVLGGAFSLNSLSIERALPVRNSLHINFPDAFECLLVCIVHICFISIGLYKSYL